MLSAAALALALVAMPGADPAETAETGAAEPAPSTSAAGVNLGNAPPPRAEQEAPILPGIGAVLVSGGAGLMAAGSIPMVYGLIILEPGEDEPGLVAIGTAVGGGAMLGVGLVSHLVGAGILFATALLE